ncbi:integrase [Rickettsiales endosymbiont of Peranema trichophorum]|uniref:tyrosine-type recombinase/integrase n=1 Tax=Rickettsiales endosymbiont of Peranema trichophorum TaxID=2486577 RepID=UPI001023B217|nr:tyrosine-type recombinase/integrase [Rickettsiales endosymbiont of Peranema trichophorum]RZI45096.1 integrase [Rickettsiales endosymbiont of Peranema trichophorum]
MSDIITPETLLSTINSVQEKMRDYAQHAFAKNTYRNYKSDWKSFCFWCELSKIDPWACTPHILSIYITTLAEQNYKVSTIQRKLCAISTYYQYKDINLNLNDREFKAVWQGIRRKLGIAKRGKNPILVKTLKLMLQDIPSNTNIGLRDAALLAFGWSSAMRRSEIVALNWSDISFVDEGVIVTIRQSKTDKFGEGQKIAILYGRHKLTCPVTHLSNWKAISYTAEDQPVFCAVSRGNKVKHSRLSCIDVARIVKKYIRSIGLDDSVFAGHSLRSGLITSASKNSVPDYVIMKHSRHKSAQMIHVYTRDQSLINDNVTGMLGL